MNTYTAKHNPKKHTVTIHAPNCACIASGSVWTIEASSVKEAMEIAREDAPNVSQFQIAPCARSKHNKQLTIYEALRLKLGREPTHSEIKADVKRILAEALVERASKGKLQHQRSSCMK